MKDEKKHRDWKNTAWQFFLAILLALVIRTFVVEAFVVPTGSMAPTIYGRNLTLECPKCGYRFAIGWNAYGRMSRFKRPPSVVCPICGEEIKPGFFSFSAGDRFFVSRFVHKITGLHRWDVVVFWCPEVRKNYVKRLVGFPGETVRIIGGDVYINGTIARKPPEVQRHVWKPLSREKMGDSSRWKLYWHPGGNVSEEREAIEIGKGGSITYALPIDDFVEYNAASIGYGWEKDKVDVAAVRRYAPKNTVRDIKASFRITLTGGKGTAFFVKLAQGTGDERLLFSFQPDGATIHGPDGKPLWRGNVAFKKGENVLECAVVDFAAYLKLNEKVVAYRTFDPKTAPSWEPTAVLGVRKGTLSVSEASTWRDVYYCRIPYMGIERAVDEPYTLSRRRRDPVTGKWTGYNEYFFLGDNSWSSRDCRVLDIERYPITDKDIRGRVILRWWPITRFGLVR